MDDLVPVPNLDFVDLAYCNICKSADSTVRDGPGWWCDGCCTSWDADGRNGERHPEECP